MSDKTLYPHQSPKFWIAIALILFVIVEFFAYIPGWYNEEKSKTDTELTKHFGSTSSFSSYYAENYADVTYHNKLTLLAEIAFVISLLAFIWSYVLGEEKERCPYCGRELP